VAASPISPTSLSGTPSYPCAGACTLDANEDATKRDWDQLTGHVIGAETAYACKLGIKRKQPATGDTAAIEELREAIAAVVCAPSDGSPAAPSGWTKRYAASRCPVPSDLSHQQAAGLGGSV
jgi:hypothetical protein